MSRRYRSALGATAIIVATIALVAIPVAGQTQRTDTKAKMRAAADAAKKWTVPRTPDGHPDLQGVWANNFATPLERPKELGNRQFLSDEELAKVAQA